IAIENDELNRHHVTSAVGWVRECSGGGKTGKSGCGGLSLPRPRGEVAAQRRVRGPFAPTDAPGAIGPRVKPEDDGWWVGRRRVTRPLESPRQVRLQRGAGAVRPERGEGGGEGGDVGRVGGKLAEDVGHGEPGRWVGPGLLR